MVTNNYYESLSLSSNEVSMKGIYYFQASLKNYKTLIQADLGNHSESYITRLELRTKFQIISLKGNINCFPKYSQVTRAIGTKGWKENLLHIQHSGFGKLTALSHCTSTFTNKGFCWIFCISVVCFPVTW